MKKNTFYFISLLFLLFITRFLNLNEAPPGINDDEVINLQPVTKLLNNHEFFWFIEDEREPLFYYLLSFYFLFFPRTMFFVRLFPAVIGSLTVLLTYYLLRQLYDTRTGYYSAVILAISNWHYHFSRLLYRAILTPITMLLVLYLTKNFYEKKKNTWFLAIITSFFIFYIYGPAKFLVLVPITYYLFTQEINKHSLVRTIKLYAIVVLISLPIIIPNIFFDKGMDRTHKVVYIFKDYLSVNQKIMMFFNLMLDYVKMLFFFGCVSWQYNYPLHPLLSLFEFIFFPLGLFFSTKNKKEFLLLCLLLFFGAFTEFISFDSPNAVRSLQITPIIALISAKGFTSLINLNFFKKNFSKKQRSNYQHSFFILLVILSLTLNLKNYYAWSDEHGTGVTFHSNYINNIEEFFENPLLNNIHYVIKLPYNQSRTLMTMYLNFFDPKNETKYMIVKNYDEIKQDTPFFVLLELSNGLKVTCYDALLIKNSKEFWLGWFTIVKKYFKNQEEYNIFYEEMNNSCYNDTGIKNIKYFEDYIMIK